MPDLTADEFDLFGIPGGGLKTHGPSQCAGTACCIHNPSGHRMRDWPLNWRGDRGLMERLCPCGIGHPDPDDAEYQRRIGRDVPGIHGCCGHCSEVPRG